MRDDIAPASDTVADAPRVTGSQTLSRGLELLEAVGAGKVQLRDLSVHLGLARSTAHRLASALVEHQYLVFSAGQGFALGPKLLQLGYLAGQQMNLPRMAHPYLETLAAGTGDTVHLAIIDGSRALYLDKVSGARRVEISSRVGDRQPIRSTGVGKALILDAGEDRWRELYEYENREGRHYGVDQNEWLRRMRRYAELGHAFDLEENEDRIRCVAAPVRDAGNQIIAAISVSSAAHYMDDARLEALTNDVKAVAGAVSMELGWPGAASTPG